MSDSPVTPQTPSAGQRPLAESLRQQYLAAMGIQVWYDPAQPVPDIPEAVVETAEMESVAPAQAGSSQVVTPSVAAQIPVQAEPSASSQPAFQSAVPDDIDIAGASPEHRQAALAQLNTRIAQCQLCELHASRAHAVCGEGNADARLLIISDAPLSDRAQDALFDAAEKRLLQAMMQAIGLDLSQVYLTSLVKCMPPQRAPYTSEMICCDDHLSAQIKLIQPAAIMLLGEQASRQLLVSQKSLTDLRQRHHQHLGVPVYASYHPRDLLDSAQNKGKVWQDLLQIKHRLTTQT